MNTSLTRGGERNAQKGVFLKMHIAAVVWTITGQNTIKIGVWEREGGVRSVVSQDHSEARVAIFFLKITKMTENCTKNLFRPKFQRMASGVHKKREICKNVVRKGVPLFIGGSVRLTLIVVDVGPLGCPLAKMRANCARARTKLSLHTFGVVFWDLHASAGCVGLTWL